jgi:Flp pilus assembly protein TadG
VIFAAGEWVGAWLGLSATFLVAALGVVGLGWWVLRKDALNRAAEDAAERAAAEPPSQEGHH